MKPFRKDPYFGQQKNEGRNKDLKYHICGNFAVFYFLQYFVVTTEPRKIKSWEIFPISDNFCLIYKDSIGATAEIYLLACGD